MNFSQKTVIIPLLCLILWLTIGYRFTNYFPIFSSYYTSTGINQKIDTNISSLDIFATPKIQKTMDIIRKYSYGFEKKTNIDIENAVMKSIVDGLGDKHSTYFTQKETNEFEEALRGDFEWIGAVINENPKGIKIMKIISWSPAEKAGLKQWDIMTKVGDVSIIGKSVEDAVKVIRWPKWTTAEITYKRWEESIDLHTSVFRDKVSVPSVAEKMLDSNIGYIEISTFGEHTFNEFIKAWNTLTQSHANGIILDFRNNGWGYLDTAVELASTVLQKSLPVVIIKQNDISKNETFMTKGGIKNNVDIPIIILINEFSASASEIFAGALKDHKRGLILGEKSYGKWSVQEPFDLWDGSIIKITTARWYTPNDTSIDEKGILPDTRVSLTNKDYENAFDRQLKAAEIILADQIKNKRSVSDILEIYKTNNFISLTGSTITK